MSKIDIRSLEKIIKENQDIMVESNVIGADFSLIDKCGGVTAKIEPMMYYDFLTPKENALLSFIFIENDFLTSGLSPEYAMIDFESPKGEFERYKIYMNEIYKIMRKNSIKLVSAHTGDYGNINYGITGSMVLISFNRPIFSLEKISVDSSFYLIGKIGLEYKYFEHKINEKYRKVNERDLSISELIDKLKGFNGKIEYVHDLAEGGLYRALQEISHHLKTGFKLSFSDLSKLIPDDLMELGTDIFYVSSSGAAIVSLAKGEEKEFENYMKHEFAKIRKVSRGLWIDDNKLEIKEDLLSEILKK